MCISWDISTHQYHYMQNNDLHMLAGKYSSLPSTPTPIIPPRKKYHVLILRSHLYTYQKERNRWDDFKGTEYPVGNGRITRLKLLIRYPCKRPVMQKRFPCHDFVMCGRDNRSHRNVLGIVDAHTSRWLWKKPSCCVLRGTILLRSNDGTHRFTSSLPR